MFVQWNHHFEGTRYPIEVKLLVVGNSPKPSEVVKQGWYMGGSELSVDELNEVITDMTVVVEAVRPGSEDSLISWMMDIGVPVLKK